MTDATDHALEQAERIVQYAKYSDRFMVVEGDSPAERRAFVKLIGQKLPRQVRPVILRADAGNGASAMIEQLSTLLQLSAGIETIDQLISAATAALDGQERLLIVVENADQWLDSDGAEALFDLINQAHDLARERMLFLLVGTSGLCERVETAQPLAGLVADLHCAHLLGTSGQAHESPAAATATSAGHAAVVAPAPETPAAATPEPAAPARRSAWASPTLLIAGVVSIAVVSIGAFALLGRSEAPTSQPAETSTTADEKAASTSAAPAAKPDTGTESGTEASAEQQQGGAQQAQRATPLPDLSEIDHGQPPLVPFPADGTSQASADAAAQPAEETAVAEDVPAEPAVQPVPQEARGAAPATPPADVDNSWYRDQPRARAAIQMAAFGKLDDATGLIDRYASDGQPREEWRIYTQRIDGKVLYTVTFGNYASTERARHAIDDLPAALRGLKPYPRSVGAIQDRLADSTS